MTPRMELDQSNPVVALCAAGMAAGGDTSAAAECFARAWAARRDDCDAAVAAHYMAHAQSNATAKLEWDVRAVAHAEAALAAGDQRARTLMPSLYLNLGDGLLAAERIVEARAAAARANASLSALPDDGYSAFVAAGIDRLRRRAESERVDAAR